MTTFSILVFSLLIDIKEQLNTIQADVNDLKRKMTLYDEGTSSKLIKIDATGTALTSKMEKVEKKFINIHNLIDLKGIGKTSRPIDFPTEILHHSFQELERFDDLLHEFDDPFAVYYVSLTEIFKRLDKNLTMLNFSG
jgi:hypothetical protein